MEWKSQKKKLYMKKDLKIELQNLREQNDFQEQIT